MREHTQRFDPRQHMRRPDFEIFHYQDRSPTDIEVHHHDFYEIYFFLSGNVEYRVEGRSYLPQPGDLILVNPTELHQLITVSEDSAYERIVLWINKSYLEGFSSPELSLTRCFDNTLPTHTNLLHLTPAQHADIRLKLVSLIREHYGVDYGNELCAQSILIQLLVELNRLAAGAQPKQEQGDSSSLVSQIMAYISEHYNEEISLDGLAQLFYMSKYHLSHEFSRVVGTSVYRYINLKRLLIARQMLSNGVAPGVVYTHCGFGDYANFYRAFKAQYGISPRACMPGEI
jgi:AraC-like DNA-binding protein